MPAYDIVERFGRYAMVRYTGIGTTGYRDLEAETPVDPTFRSTGVIEDVYERGTNRVEWGLEVWIVTDSPRVSEEDVIRRLQEMARAARVEIPFISFSRAQVKVQTNQPLIPPEGVHGWRGRIRVKGMTYQYNFYQGEMQW